MVITRGQINWEMPLIIQKEKQLKINMDSNITAYKQGILSQAISKLQYLCWTTKRYIFFIVAEKKITKNSITNNKLDKLQEICQSKMFKTYLKSPYSQSLVCITP